MLFLYAQSHIGAGTMPPRLRLPRLRDELKLLLFLAASRPPSCSSSVSSESSELLSRPTFFAVSALLPESDGGGDGDGELRDSVSVIFVDSVVQRPAIAGLDNKTALIACERSRESISFRVPPPDD